MGLVSRRREGSVRLVKVEASRKNAFTFLVSTTFLCLIRHWREKTTTLFQLHFHNRRPDKEKDFATALISGPDGRAEDKTLDPFNRRPLAWHAALHSSSRVTRRQTMADCCDSWHCPSVSACRVHGRGRSKKIFSGSVQVGEMPRPIINRADMQPASKRGKNPSRDETLHE